MTPFLARWAVAFALTQAIEMPVYWRALPGRPRRERLALAFGASGLTHPAVWFVIPSHAAISGVPTVLVAEAFAVLAEAAWLGALGVRQPLAWSLLANGLSAGLAFLNRAIAFGWP